MNLLFSLLVRRKVCGECGFYIDITLYACDDKKSCPGIEGRAVVNEAQLDRPHPHQIFQEVCRDGLPYEMNLL